MGASLMGVDQAAQARLDEAEPRARGGRGRLGRDQRRAGGRSRAPRPARRSSRTSSWRPSPSCCEHGATVPDERDDLEPALRELRSPGRGGDRGTWSPSCTSPRRPGARAPRCGRDAGRGRRPGPARGGGVGARSGSRSSPNERRRLESRLVQAHARSRGRGLGGPRGRGRPARADRHVVADTLKQELSAARAAEEDLLEALEAPPGPARRRRLHRRGRRPPAAPGGGRGDRRGRRRRRRGAHRYRRPGPGRVGPGVARDRSRGDRVLPAGPARRPAAGVLRRVGAAGLDDALAGVGEADVRQMLEGLGRMAESRPDPLPQRRPRRRRAGPPSRAPSGRRSSTSGALV